MFEFSQIRCFVAVAEELHFGRAAARLNMTQPPLSRQIQLLERALSVVLLERNSRSAKLTNAGRTFLIEARRILRLSESAALMTRRVAAGEAGTLTIGFTAVAGYDVLPQVVENVRKNMPDADLVLREMVSGEQIEALLAGRIDIGLLRPPIERKEFSSLRIREEHLVAVLPQNDPKASRRSLKLADFDGLPLIMYSNDGARYFHDMLISMFHSANTSPNYIQHMTQVHSIIALVRAGLGVAIVPASAVNLCFNGVVMRRLVTQPQKPVELYMAWHKKHDNPILEQVVELIAAQKPMEPNLKMALGNPRRNAQQR